MAALLGTQSKQPQTTQPTTASGLNITTSVFGKVVPVIFGTVRTAGNVVWEGNFQSISHSSGGGAQGSKGGGSGGGGSSTYTYTDCMALLLCEGPINGIGTIWNDKTASTAANLNFSVFNGTYPQAGWTRLTSFKTVAEQHIIPATAPYQIQVNWVATASFTNVSVASASGLTFSSVNNLTAANQYTVDAVHSAYNFSALNAAQLVTVYYQSDTQQPPNQAHNYNGFAYLGGWNLDLGSSNSLPNYNVEIYGFLTNPSLGIYDANAADMVNMMLTNNVWGGGSYFPSSKLADLTSWKNYGTATGIHFSVAYTEQTTLAQAIGDLATYSNTDIACTTSLNFIPRGESAIGSYNPLTPSFSFTDDDWLETSNASTATGSQVSDPLVASRVDPSNIVNQIQLEYLNRANAYAPEPATAEDYTSVRKFGLKTDQTRQAHFFADAAAAHMSAKLMLKRGLAPNTYSGSVGELGILTQIGDTGYIQSDASKIPQKLVRVVDYTEQSDGSHTFIFEEIKVGIGVASALTLPVAQSIGRGYNADPGNTDAPMIFEPPLELVSQGTMEVWLYANGGPSWNGCHVYISSDNVTYAYYGTISGRGRIGTLTSALAAGKDPDTINSLSLKLIETGQIMSGSQSDADSFNTDLYVDGEIISYANATLTGTQSYTLSYLRRGGYGTTNTAHAVGARVVCMDQAVFKIPYTAPQIGKTLYVKLPAFNAFGGGLQDYGSLEPFTYTILGQEPPANIQGLSTVYNANLLKAIWYTMNDPRGNDYEVRLGQSWNNAQVLGNPATPSFQLVGDGTYWVAARVVVPNGPTLYSPQPQSIIVSGSALTSHIVATVDQAANGWKGTFSNTALEKMSAYSGTLLTLAGGDLLQVADITKLSDIFTTGAVVSAGTYTIPASDQVTLATAAACQVMVTLGAIYPMNINAIDISKVTDITQITDVLSFDAGGHATVTPQISLNGGAWQTWVPGSYYASNFNFRLLLATTDSQYTIYVPGFKFTVDVPSRTDNYSVATSATANTVITYTTGPFNGSITGNGQPPHLTPTIQNAQSGDVLNIVSSTVSAFTFNVTNGGTQVVRNVNLIAQGY